MEAYVSDITHCPNKTLDISDDATLGEMSRVPSHSHLRRLGRLRKWRAQG